MKRIAAALAIPIVILLAATGSATTPSGRQTSPSAPNSIEVTRDLTSMPLAFTENQGQWDKQVLFRANAGGATLWFTRDGAVYQFTRRVPTNSTGAPQLAVGSERFDHQPDSIESITIKASFIGANPNPQMTGIDAIEYKCNYFIGNDPNEWHTDVPNYNAIVYEEIYTGIDLKYYGNGRQMEYDFIVEPGADYSQIEIQYEDVESISINDNGELVVKTMWGEVVEQKPVIYQMYNNSRVAIAGEYNLKGDNSFGFSLSSSYDPALPLVIDPVLAYSTYLGGSSEESGLGIAVDTAGAAYVTGYTFSADFPTLNPYQGTLQNGNWDVFVTKISGSGNSLIYSTYIGGNSFDYGSDIAVDASGAVFVTGRTSSVDFPTLNPYQEALLGDTADASDAYVTKLNSTGNGLIYSTYLGGSDYDSGGSIAVDATGAAHVTGTTSSTDFPTLNPYQGALQNSERDVFVTKISSLGNSLIYSTYLGGGDIDIHGDIAVDATGAVYLSGYTRSTDFPLINPYQASVQGSDAFVCKLSSSGDSLVYSTYLGGGGSDWSAGLVLDASGAAYVTGYTNSTDFPTLNPYQGTLQGSSDLFISKLSSSGNSLIYSTYLGGGDSENGSDIAVDAFGAAYVTGATMSVDFPTLNPYQGIHQGDYWDAFVTKLSTSGDSLVYSTYLGGSGVDFGYDIAVDVSGAAYVTGKTESTDFPTLNQYQADQDTTDAFVTKLSEAIVSCCLPPIRGNIDYDPGDVIDMADLVYLVDYMFTGGPEPPCLDEADVDGSGGESPIDISDLVYLVDYMFNGGPEPVPCP